MYRFLLTSRWLVLNALALLLIPLFIALGSWQLDRFHQRRTAELQMSANVSAAPVPLETLDSPGGVVDRSRRWRTVTTTGAYDPAHELLVRRRIQNGLPGFYVLTPLVTPNGTAVLVNRGWVRLADTPAARPDVPAPLPGTVRVTGRLEPSERTGGPNSGLPQGQITRITTSELAQRVPYPLYGGYVDLVDQQPQAASAPEAVPAPDTVAGGFASSWQNLAYVSQWWLFTLMVPVGWIILVRREAREIRGRTGAGTRGGRPDTPVPGDTRHGSSGDPAGAPAGRPSEQVGATPVPAKE